MTTVISYESSLKDQTQAQLEALIDMYAAHSSDATYNDIIIPRNNIVEFIRGLTIIGVAIQSINWWCHATEENKNKFSCPHGYGGPMTKVGWFSEMSHDSDDMSETEKFLFHTLDTNFNSEIVKIINNRAIELIQNKQTITYAYGRPLTFRNNPCLTPSFDLYVHKDWTRKTNDPRIDS